MKTKLIFRCLTVIAAAGFLSLGADAQNVNVAGALVGNGSYATLGAAFTAINSGAQTGATIQVTVVNNTTEGTATATLNAGAWTSLSIQPVGGMWTISGTTTAGNPMVDFNGADNVTVNGLNNGTEALTFTNTTASATSGTSTIRFAGDATSNTITRCSVLGASTMQVTTNGGNIWFGAGAVTTGNDNNTISFCNIGPAGATLPTKGIYFSGTSAALSNSGINITNNNIYDFFSATTTSAGVYITAGSSDITIQNNKFYQSATRTQTSGVQHSSVWITNTSGNNYTVSGNTIGYNTAASTGTYTFAGISGSTFVPIFLNVGSTTASNIQGNTITAIAVSGAMNGTTNSAPFRGIFVSEGLVNIGNTVANTVGSLLTNGAITYTSTNTINSEVIGIYNFSSFNAVISNNNIGGITAGNSSTGAAIIQALRINTVAAATSTVQNNNIGGATIGSIQSTSLSTNSQVFGIYINTSNATITGNNIASMTILSGVGTTTSPSVGGIVVNATSSNHTITGNRIAAFGSLGPASTGNVTGIMMACGTGTNIVGENFIHSLVTASASATINGIYVSAGTCTYRNNMIRLGIDPAGSALTAGMIINGINETSAGTDNFYFNTIYIGGSGVGGSANTFAFQSSITTNVRNFQNNIFWNARSNGAGTGKHYAIRVGGTAANPAGLTSNYNDIYVTGTGGVTGLFNGVDQATIVAWRAATGQDANSLTGDPILVNPTGDGTLVDLHIGAAATPVEQSGTPIAAVTIDFDGQTRSGLTPTDIGADAGNFTQLDIFPPVITYTTLPGTCSTADRVVTATITDFTGVPTAGVLQPRIYYRKNAGPYFSSQGVLTTGSATNGTWTFTIIGSDMGGVTFFDQVSYYIIAQDIVATPNITSNPSTGLVATDVNTVTTHPTANSYTINGTLNGTYTVGIGGAFTTITAAVTAYNNACNITGPILFSLIDATYPSETFPITINPNAFASSVNTLTIKPATGVSPTITGSSAVAIFRLFGADFITIDGSNTVSGTTRDLTIRNTNAGLNSTIAWVSCFDATNGANNNTIKNCVVAGNATTTTLGCIVSSGTTVGGVAETANANNTYQNNGVSTAFYGIAIVGPTANESGTVITGNSIGSAVAANKIGYQGIFVAQEANVTISDNVIAGIDCPLDMGTTVASAICIGGTQTGGSILRNRITDIKNSTAGGYGAAGILLAGTVSTSNMTVANNFVSDITGIGFGGIGINDNGYGIAVNGSGYNLYHNTVTLNTNQSLAGARSAALWISSTPTAGSLDVRNNLFINAQTTGNANQRYAIYCAAANTIFSNINYNDYFTNATNLGFLGSNRANLAAIQTGFGGNTNSVNILPVFTSTTDLHLPVASNPTLQDLAATLPSITTDIDLQPRSTCGTEMGADEIGTPREIEVSGNSVAITDGATTTSTADFTDFGTQSVCNGTLTRTFVINNTGTAALTISSVTISGANAADFTVTTAPAGTVAGSGNTSFVITFNPSAAGARNAIINVNNNDCDEAIFDFAVLGTGTQIAASAASQTNVTCNGGNNGAATVATTSGIAPLTYAWAPSGGTAATASGLIAGTYTCTVTDANGCTATQIFVITEPAALTVSASAGSPTICDGSSTSLTASGASTYTWMPGSLSGTIVSVSPTSTTTYTVTGTDGSGCTGTGMVTVTVNPLPVVTASATPATTCAGGSTLLTAIGATTYNWMPGSLSGASVTDIPSSTTTYTVTGMDGNGCSATGNVTVTVNPLPTVTASAGTPTICSGNSTTLTGNGASTYTWMPGSLSGTTVTVSPTSTTTYTVTGTDGNGCFSTDVVTVTVNPLPTVTASAVPATICVGSSTSLTGNGATTYSWMPGSLSGANVTDIPSSTTTYTVTGTDGNGCSSTDVVTVTVNPLPTVTATAGTPTICNGGSTTLTGNGATTYTWMPGSLSGTTVSVSPTTTTTYTVTGTDGAGCSSTDVVTVTVNPLPTVTATAGTPTICNGGSSTLTGNGATTYTWMPGSLSGTTVTVSPTTTTTYTVTGTDGNGCSATDVVTVTVNPLPTVSATAGTPIICSGNSSTLTGNGAATYAWMPGSLSGTTVTVSPTTTTTYTVTGTDVNGCVNTGNVTVTVNPTPTVTATAGTPTICNGASSTLTGNGASTYTWMPGALSGTTVTVSPTATTTYTVTGTSGAGCSSTDVITVTVNPLPTVSATAGTPTICSGNSSTLTGNGAIIYAWMPGSLSGTTVTVSPITTTTYTVTGTDGNGCSNTGNVTVTVNPTPTVTATAGTPTICSGNSSTLTGNGASTYTWMPGSLSGTTVTVSPATTTTYTVTGTTGSCSSTAVVTVTVNPTPTVAATAGTPTICSGNSSTLTGNGASTYTWMPGSLSGTTVTVSPTTTTTYTVTGTSGAGCSSTGLVTVTVNPTPVVNLGTDITQCSGTALLDAQNAGATYLWSDNSTSQTLTVATTGIYWVDVTNASGCTSRDSISVTINSSPVVAFGPDITQCGGTVLLDAGNPGSTYLWNDNSTNQTLTVTTSGIYSVLATLPGGCTATDTITVTINALPTVSATAGAPTICSGNSSTLTGNGATTYAWMPGSLSGTTVTVSPTTTTTYTVTGTDGNGCSNTGNVTVTVNPTPTVTATAGTPTICSGNSSTLTGNGASTYTWMPGALSGTTVTVSPTTTTTYTVTGTSGAGCSSTGLVTVTVNPTPTVTATAGTPTICNGGSSTLTGNGATTYTWMPGALSGTTVTVSPTATTTYTVTGTSGAGCSSTGLVTVTVNPLPTVTATAGTPTICSGNSSTLTGNGATTYAWMPGSLSGTTVTVSPTTTTTYTVTGTDVNGCSNTGNVTVTVNPTPTVTATAGTPTICNGGSSTLTGNGATTYTWMPGALSGTTVTVSPTTTTTYTVTGTSGAGCSSNGLVTVTVNPLPTVTATAGTPTICNGGSSTLTGNGATTYTWMPGSLSGTTVTVSPTATTTYTVTGTNGAGCSNTGLVTVTVNPLPTVSATAGTPTICSGNSSTLTGNGATTYAWMPGALSGTTVTVSPATTTTYTVTGTDGNGCSNTGNVTVTVNPTPTVTATAGTPTICNGGSSTLTGNGATTYTWMPGALTGTTVTVSPTATTTYTVTGTSGAGCSSTGLVTVTVNPLPTVSATAGTPTICSGNSSTLTGNGATTYAWMPGSLSGTTVTVSPTTTTTYTVTGTDGNGCSNTGNVTVTVNPTPTVTATAGTPTICSGGSSTLTGNGVTTYTWMPGALSGTTVSVSPTATTTYTVTGTTGAGCSSTGLVTVTVNPTPTVTATAGTPTICNGGSSTLTGNGASTYTWMPGALSGTTVTVSPTATTTYTVTGTSGAGCSSTALVTVTVNPLPTVSATAGTPTICSGNSSTLTGNGATTYAWMPGSLSGTTVTVSPTTTTTYTVTGTDGNGCSNTGNVTVTVNPTPTVTATAGTPTICSGNSSTLTGNGASTYTWMPGALSGTTVTVSPATTTTYTVTGTSGAGCSSTGLVTVTVNPTPTVTATAGTPTICNGGSSTLTGNGASTYTWMPGALSGTTVTVSPTATTTYTVTGTSGAGCSSTGLVTVTVNPLPTVTANTTASTVCAGTSVTLTGGGATSYTWSGGVIDAVAFVPAATATYTVTGTDVNGCVNTASTTVTVNPLPVVNLGPDVTQCAGTVLLNAQNAGSTYLWNDNSTSQTLTASATGIYWVDVTNTNGCVKRDSINVTINANPVVTLGADITQCGGTALLDAGNVGATYLWSDNSTNQTLTVSATGTYSVIVTNASGCTGSDAINVTINAMPVVNLGADITQCAGTALLDAQNAGSTYLWNDNTTAQTLTASATGIYWVDVTTVNGCTTRDSISVTINANPVVALGADITQCGGTALLDAQNAGATYLWSDNSTNQTLTATTSGTYHVLVTLATGCSASDTIVVTINNLPTVALGVDTTQCGGSVLLDAQNAGAAYLWSDNSTAQTLTATATGVYHVTVTDPSGCVSSDTINVTINAVPVVALGNDTTMCGGSVLLDAQNAGATYLWSDNSVAQTLAATSTGVYAVAVTDASGCTTNDTISITINPVPVVNLGPDSATCAATVLLDAGNPGDTYLWSDNTTSQTLTATTTGIYWVDVTNASGCTSRDSVSITINSNPVVTLGNDTTMCGGSLLLDAGNAGANYLWSDNSTNQTLLATASGTYFVVATLSGGCTATDTIVVTINAAPVVNLGADISQCGGTALLDAGVTANGDYLWSDNSTNQTLSVSTSGFYYVTVTDTTSGCAASDSINVAINAAPSITFSLADTLCDNGGAVVMNATPAGGTYFGTGVSGNSFDPSFPGPGTTTITYSYTDANGCSATTNESVFIDDCSGILEPVNNASILVYPNPNNGQFTLVISQMNGEGVLEITDALGQLISSETVAPANGSIRKEVNLGMYASGIYFVRFTTNATSTVQKVNVQR